jgi:suppressor for copper-sensitivity B
LALVGTAIWLLTILAAGSGGLSVALVGAAMILAAAALWARRRWPEGLRLASPAAVAVLAVLAMAAPAGLGRDGGTAAPDHRWQPFDLARVAGLVDQGQIVFVDVTAEWCITCIVNKRLVLDGARVSERLARPDVVAMQADWTLPSDAIAHYLASFGRYGIPFNAVYGPGAPGGIALPEILREEAVLEAVRAAGG